MYCYVMKLLFLNPQLYTPNQAETSMDQATGNLISVATLVVNGNLGAGYLQPNEYAMYLCMSSTDLYCALYICFGRGSKKNKRKKKVATRYHVALCCSSNRTACTPKVS